MCLGAFGEWEFDSISGSMRQGQLRAPCSPRISHSNKPTDHAFQGGSHGENLALNYATPTLAIDSWAGEESKYNFGEGKFGEKTGHFTQLVWQNTRRVGCGAVKCDTDGE